MKTEFFILNIWTRLLYRLSATIVMIFANHVAGQWVLCYGCVEQQHQTRTRAQTQSQRQCAGRPLGFAEGRDGNFDGSTYMLATDVPAKHKFATESLAPGSDVIMYGVLVGKAMEPIAQGEVLRRAILIIRLLPFTKNPRTIRWTPPDVSRWRETTFLGYHRADGQVGTRNYWLVVPLVFCENRNIAVLKQAFEEELGFAAPQIYRQQVAEFVRLYRTGARTKLTAAGTGRASGSAPSIESARLRKCRRNQVPDA